MRNLDPIPPPDLNVLAADILNRLSGQAGAEHIVIGGGVALQHYCPHRETVDLDGWWRDRARQETEVLLERVLKAAALERGWTFRRRAFGDTQSFELMNGNRAVFKVQLALRSVELDAPLLSAWSPVLIETFRDNLAAKMNALVGRGAPRDFADVFEICNRRLAIPAECWELWQKKNLDQDIAGAKSRVLHLLEQIASRRPLSAVADPVEKERAERLRAWVRSDLCAEPL